MRAVPYKEVIIDGTTCPVYGNGIVVYTDKDRFQHTFKARKEEPRGAFEQRIAGHLAHTEGPSPRDSSSAPSSPLATPRHGSTQPPITTPMTAGTSHVGGLPASAFASPVSARSGETAKRAKDGTPPGATSTQPPNKKGKQTVAGMAASPPPVAAAYSNASMHSVDSVGHGSMGGGGSTLGALEATQPCDKELRRLAKKVRERLAQA